MVLIVLCHCLAKLMVQDITRCYFLLALPLRNDQKFKMDFMLSLFGADLFSSGLGG